MSPVLHVGALAQENVAERSVSCVAGPGKHHVLSADFSGEEHPVPVIGQESILQLMECLKIISVCDTDGGAVIAVAPGNVIPILDPCYPGIIAVLPLGHFRIVPCEGDGLMVDLPVDGVLAETCKDIHAHRQAVTAEHSRIAVLKRHHRAVENAVGDGNVMPADNRVLRIAPDGAVTVLGPLLPGHARKGFSNNLVHLHILLKLCPAIPFYHRLEKN